MILPDRRDAVHKAWLYRLLTALTDDLYLAGVLRFKGGTCASMRGFLDRFSIDLDFDYIGPTEGIIKTRNHMENIFKELNLEIKTQSIEVPQYFLKYANPLANERNTLKVDTTTNPPLSNRYEPVRLIEIDRIVNCPTIQTMFANKLVAIIERYELHRGIAGRDLYDIHAFFLRGFTYSPEIIMERRHITDISIFFQDLVNFIQSKITQTTIDQDLNVLMPISSFRRIRASLKNETIMFLKDELQRIT